MSQTSEILREHLTKVPQPLQAVIREHLAKDILQTGLGDLKARFGLSDEQVESVMTECIMVLCQVTPAEELKDSLIAECDVSYETAVRIQRLFETEVLLPISNEAAARGYGAAKEDAAEDTAPQRSDESEILYQDRYVTITPTRFDTVDGTVSIRNIISASKGVMGREWQGPVMILGIGIAMLAFIPGVLTKFIGILVAIGGGYWLHRSKPTHIVFYTLSSGEKRTFQSTDAQRVKAIAGALHDAMSR